MLNIEEIKRRREMIGISQAQAARKGKLKGGAQAWSNIEGRRVANIRLTTLLALARALRCSIADIVDEH